MGSESGGEANFRSLAGNEHDLPSDNQEEECLSVLKAIEILKKGRHFN